MAWYEDLLLMIGGVNASPFKGKAAGTLVMDAMTRPAGGSVLVTLTENPEGWNTLPDPDGRRRLIIPWLFAPTEFPPESADLVYEIVPRRGITVVDGHIYLFDPDKNLRDAPVQEVYEAIESLGIPAHLFNGEAGNYSGSDAALKAFCSGVYGSRLAACDKLLRPADEPAADAPTIVEGRG